MDNYCVAISVKGKEYLYNPNTTILCKNEKQAIILRDHLNKNNDSARQNFKCKENEIWHVHADIEPMYKLNTTKEKIIVIEI